MTSEKHCHLSVVFNLLGIRLFGTLWSGYEIWGRRYEDPAPILAVRAPYIARLEETFSERQRTENELREVIGADKIQRLNNQISNLKDEQAQIYTKLHDYPEPNPSDIEDHARWERFETTEQYLLRAFRNGELTVVCHLGVNVTPHLWNELPEGFGYDWDLSLVLMPERETCKRVNSGYINREEFESWLYTVVPINVDAGQEMPDETKAQLWLREQLKSWNGSIKRDHYKELAMEKFPNLSGHGFKRIWDAEKTEKMTRPGPKIIQ